MTTTLQLKIKDYLETSHLSVKAIERQAGLKVNAVRNILQGQSKRPTSETLQALAQVLGCTVYDLLADTGESSKQTGQAKTPLQKIIRYYLDVHGLSIAKLEKKAGLKLHVVTNILSGQSRMPTAGTMHALATTMGCSVEDLLEGNILAIQEAETESITAAPGIEYPEILAESFQHILRIIGKNKYQLNLHQALQIVEEVYFYLIQKDPPQVDIVFIEWFVKRAAG